MGSEFLDYQKGVEAALGTQFPDMFISVFAKIAPEECIKPAIVLQLPTMPVSPNATLQNFLLTMKNSAFVIFSIADDIYGFNCQQLATNLGNFINYNTFGGTAQRAKVQKIEPSKIEGLHNVVVMQIDFTQDLQIFNKK